MFSSFALKKSIYTIWHYNLLLSLLYQTDPTFLKRVSHALNTYKTQFAITEMIFRLKK